MIEKFNFDSPIGILEITHSNGYVKQVCVNSINNSTTNIVKNLNIIENSNSNSNSNLKLKLKLKTINDTIENTSIIKIKKQLNEYFNASRKVFDLPLELQGTTFQQKVWLALQKIPYGQTKTYGEIANEIGHPKSARAVGNACNKNKLLLLIPCHRVIGANQNLTGFALSIPTKQFLLNLEKL